MDRGGRRFGVSNAHQVIEQQYILIGGIVEHGAHLVRAPPRRRARLFGRLRATAPPPQGKGHRWYATRRKPKPPRRHDDGPSRPPLRRAASCRCPQARRHNHTSPSADRSIQEACDRCDFQLAPYQRSLQGAASLRPAGQAKKTTGQHRSINALEAHLLRIGQQGGVLNEPGGGFAEHHPAGRCHRLHPLRHSDLLTDCGVREWG